MAVNISGMFGNNKTYFADSPVVIDISGLEWGDPVTSPFTVVRVEVIYNGAVYGKFRADTGGQKSISFDISSALRAIWANHSFDSEAAAVTGGSSVTRTYRLYSIKVYTEYLNRDGQWTETESEVLTGGSCAVGGMTELERSMIVNKEYADVSSLQGTNTRNGDASTKPHDTPERVGSTSITSWVDLSAGGTYSKFYAPDPSHPNGTADSAGEHAPLVLRDSQPYVDFLFLNRRGAIETCSGLTKEAMGVNTDVKQYSRTERPAFKPTRSLTAVGTDGRRSWQMSSGYVTREWAEWWAMEFLAGKRKQWWMLWQGPGMDAPRYVPVMVEPKQGSVPVYDTAKGEMPHVDFTVKLALEG